jgi:hypothetical protein
MKIENILIFAGVGIAAYFVYKQFLSAEKTTDTSKISYVPIFSKPAEISTAEYAWKVSNPFDSLKGFFNRIF